MHIYLIPNVVMQHPNDRRSFAVRNCIKYFIYFRWMAHINLGEKRRSSREQIVLALQFQFGHAGGE